MWRAVGEFINLSRLRDGHFLDLDDPPVQMSEQSARLGRKGQSLGRKLTRGLGLNARSFPLWLGDVSTGKPSQPTLLVLCPMVAIQFQ